jgi:hypothetical protein
LVQSSFMFYPTLPCLESWWISPDFSWKKHTNSHLNIVYGSRIVCEACECFQEWFIPRQRVCTGLMMEGLNGTCSHKYWYVIDILFSVE